jgi:acetate kinase
MRVLCLDSGSSSLKYAMYEMPSERALTQDVVEASGPDAQRAVVSALFQHLSDAGTPPDAIGHRVVFGGVEHNRPQRVDDQLLASLDRLAAFDPVHMPSALATMRCVAHLAVETPAIACFDSAFHRAMPEIAQRYPLPDEFGPMVRRYGYHGLSYEYVASVVPVAGPMVIAHLGNGASLAALRDGRPVETSMGFSPLGGIMMGTRPGDLDPGLLVYLTTAGGLSGQELSDLLNVRAGLLGVSGTSADMRVLLERANNDAAARRAIDLFVYLAVKQVGAMVAALGGLDTLVFTGGIGEHAWQIREAIGAGCAYLGVRIDPSSNREHGAVISSHDSRVVVRVVATDENLMIARHVVAVLSAPTSK